MRRQLHHYPREAKILTCVAQALHANPRRLLSFARRLVIDLYHHVNTMAARRLVIVVVDRHVNMMTAKRLAIVDPDHHESMVTAERLAISAPGHHASLNDAKLLTLVDPDHWASVIIAMILTIVDTHLRIIVTAIRKDIIIKIRLEITGASFYCSGVYHHSQMPW